MINSVDQATNLDLQFANAGPIKVQQDKGQGKWIHFQGRQLCHNCFCPLLERSTLKGKNVFPVKANSFLLELILSEGIDMQESKQEVTKIVTPIELAEICQVHPVPLTLCMLGNFACFFVVCGFFF